MRPITSTALFLATLALLNLNACTPPCEPVTGADYQNPDLDVETRVDDLLSYMSLSDKFNLLAAPKTIFDILPNGQLFETSEDCRLGIPPFKVRTISGSRGATEEATAFPVAMARAASWDVDLENRVHDAIGLEAAAFGMNLFLSPVLTIVRHPGMGRAQETYGEDSYLMGEMGVAAINGIQNHLPAQVKHFALNSIEENRYEIDIQTDERTLREIYLPHYRKAVQQAHVASVMTAYNKINGVYASENYHLLMDILKGEWGFQGMVMSDWVDGVNSTAGPVNNGLDVEMPIAHYLSQENLQAAFDAGDISEAQIDDINRRILRTKFAWGEFEPDAPPPATVIRSAAHRALAKEAAMEGMTLLKNDALLPLDRASSAAIVVLGSSADFVSLGDEGSSHVHDYGPDAVTPLQGIINAAGPVKVDYFTDLSTVEAQSAVTNADAVVVLASLDAYDEGEWIAQYQLIFPGLGGDRRDLSIHAEDLDLINQAAQYNDRLAVVLQAGSAVTVDEWEANAAAILMAWYPGVKGGDAIAATLFGDNNPSGKTPISWPKSEDQLYAFGSLMPSVVYGYYQGYRYYDTFAIEPQFPFGFGLSYTAFEYSNLQLSINRDGDTPQIMASFDLKNVGSRAGKEIAQLYVGYEHSALERSFHDLKGFAKIALEPGEMQRVTLAVPQEELRYWDVNTHGWQFEDIPYRIEIAASSRDIRLSSSIGF